MSRKRVTLSNLIRKNREELLRDRDQLEEIEKRIDEKHIITKKKTSRYGLQYN
ncbi:FbpB family small basic protein [Bacillus sp. DTU_2020_1000418_1_SI_GHA_SEK_038]|uniref:FbpB family small basic protein n=1 Tax=Bacillus sp. DTU_2020_1000418_1_SI_GHA_SEK_038 TaxID=3077585 RepID=UPI0028E220AC|nr:FbpB family small basic protein [Bacillus sp. DTU_2020_1000418_1_SI_GHA_SEK_038]WNS76134.1 FbpB family small basic protein [Bacillus sp. DTU_2020_1000418_1_SI_GHA_SEK_038]